MCVCNELSHTHGTPQRLTHVTSSLSSRGFGEDWFVDHILPLRLTQNLLVSKDMHSAAQPRYVVSIVISDKKLQQQGIFVTNAMRVEGVVCERYVKSSTRGIIKKSREKER